MGDIEKLYESIVLRDILEYFTPGSVILFSLCLLSESMLHALGVGFSVFDMLSNNNLLLGAFIVIAYALGHLLTGIDYLGFRPKEVNQAANVLVKDPWLRPKIVEVLADYMNIPKDEVDKILTDKNSSTTVREIARSLIFERRRSLYRDFVNRHSIFSRFCKNMAFALTALLLSIVIAISVTWKEVTAFYQVSPVAFIGVLIIIPVLLISAIVVFMNRSNRLRSIMIKHTFQILYTDFIESQLKPNETHEDENDNTIKGSGQKTRRRNIT